MDAIRHRKLAPCGRLVNRLLVRRGDAGDASNAPWNSELPELASMEEMTRRIRGKSCRLVSRPRYGLAVHKDRRNRMLEQNPKR